MNEVSTNIAMNLSKRAMIDLSMSDTLLSNCHELSFSIKEQFLDLLLSDLKDEDNQFQVILTIKKLL